MGFFSGLKQRWNDGSLMNGLQAAGAIANGDYATAAQIKGLYQRQRQEQQEAEAKAQQAQAAVQALIRQGIPEADAVVLVQSGAADNVLSSRFGQQADGEFTRTLKAAGIDPASDQGRALYAQRAATMASPAPQMIGSPETGYRFVTPPAPTLSGQPQAAGGPAPGTEVGGFRFKGGNPNDRNNWEPVTGGAVSNGGSNFRDAFADFLR